MTTQTFLPVPPTSTRVPSARTGRYALSGDRSQVAMANDIAAYLAGYQPTRSYASGILDWARDLVLRSRPSSERDARTLCLRCCNMGEWLRGLGYSLTEPTEKLLADGNIDAFLRDTQTALGTVQTMRSAFRRVRKATTTERKVIIAGTRTDVASAVAPASASEVAGFIRWVEGIDSSRASHWDGLMLVALIRGGGCTKADLRNVTTDSVDIQSDGGVLLHLGGSAARVVPVEACWSAPLVRAASIGNDTGSLFELDGRARSGSAALTCLANVYYRRRNALDQRAAQAMPQFLNANSYRAAWIVDRLDTGVRLDRLLREAGLVSAAALDRYLQFLPDSVAPRRAP